MQRWNVHSKGWPGETASLTYVLDARLPHGHERIIEDVRRAWHVDMYWGSLHQHLGG